jgi:hypothetical protein
MAIIEFEGFDKKTTKVLKKKVAESVTVPFVIGGWALYEGRQWLVECFIDGEVVISDSDGAEKYVPIDQLEPVKP